MLGSAYAIDFVGVDDHDRTARSGGLRRAFGLEPPEKFYAFGRDILAPVAGTVVAVHEGEVDHDARRSTLALLAYALGQASRLRQGLGAISGNCVVISPPGSGVFVAVMHLLAGSVRVSVGQDVTVGECIAKCGNSGNSTQPHVHLQAMDRLDAWTARGLPLSVDRFCEKPFRSRRFVLRENTIPDEASTVQPAPYGKRHGVQMALDRDGFPRLGDVTVSPVANTLPKSGSGT